RRRQREERIAVGPGYNRDGFVFTPGAGRPLDGVEVSKTLFRRIAKLNLDRRVRFHDLRHTAASFMLAAGVPARVVMETLGHSTIQLTLDTYSHVAPALLRDAADAMD